MSRTDAYRALQLEVERIIDAEDTAFCASGLADYSYAISDDMDEIIRNFRENYSSRRIGFQPFDHLDGDEIADAALKILSKEDFVNLILSHADAQDCDIYIQWNEIASVAIGEREYQIDVEAGTELAALIEACTPDERKDLLGRYFDGRSFLAYGRPCDRIIWKLAPAPFLEAIEPTLRAAGLTDPDDKTDEVQP